MKRFSLARVVGKKQLYDAFIEEVEVVDASVACYFMLKWSLPELGISAAFVNV